MPIDQNIQKWIKEKLKSNNISSFYYLAHRNNLESILKNGILPKNEVIRKQLNYYTFAMPEVQEKRDARNITFANHNTYNIHDMVPLYLTPKTPTLFVRREIQDDLLFLVVKSSILYDKDIEFVFSDGNAGASNTRFFYSLNRLDWIDWDVIGATHWNDFEDGRRKRCAEVLIVPQISINYIWKIVVNDIELKDFVESTLSRLNIRIEAIIDSNFFFN